MTPRKCAGCGLPEERTAKTVNLDPTLHLCVACLVAYAKECGPITPETSRWFDSRQAQTGERE